jgi:hypothetical protein
VQKKVYHILNFGQQKSSAFFQNLSREMTGNFGRQEDIFTPSQTHRSSHSRIIGKGGQDALSWLIST